MAVSPFIANLLRLAAQSTGIAAAYMAAPPPGGALADLELILVAPPEFGERLPSWLAPLGEVSLTDSGPDGCLIVTLEGEVLVVRAEGARPAGAWQMLFGREDAAAPTSWAEPPGPVKGPDSGPPVSPGRFWGHLYLALGAVGRGWCFTAHGELESCRALLTGLYRMALAPGNTASGWAGLEQLPGASRALEGMADWLVAPLEVHAQWRCAHRLAAAYEGLTLPLLQRLGAEYPWAIRNLVFRRLDEVRPDSRGGEVPAAPPPAPEPPPAAQPAGPARVKVKLRKRPE